MREVVIAGVSKRVTLVVAAIAGFVSAFMMTAVTVALPSIGQEFSMEAVLLGWVITAMNLATAAILLASGRLADIYGRKKIFLYGTIMLAVSSFLCAFANCNITQEPVADVNAPAPDNSLRVDI